ncbi:GIY-YIG nuclease family protein [Actinopolymorpha pittospori]
MTTRTSSQNLRTRVCYHFRGNAEGSTLRLTLGCLLGLELRRPSVAHTGTELTRMPRPVWARMRIGRRGSRSMTMPANNPKMSQGAPPIAAKTPT